MFCRFVPLALIAAIIACPLLCRNGDCQACGAEQLSVEPMCSAKGTGDCCCPLDSQDGSSRDDEGQPPCDEDSGESGCQGVCGGAVLKKPDSLPDPAEMSSFLSDITTDPSSPASLVADRQSQVFESWLDCGMTPGRYLCTLHMSFLL